MRCDSIPCSRLQTRRRHNSHPPMNPFYTWQHFVHLNCNPRRATRPPPECAITRLNLPGETPEMQQRGKSAHAGRGFVNFRPFRLGARGPKCGFIVIYKAKRPKLRQGHGADRVGTWRRSSGKFRKGIKLIMKLGF